MSSPNLSASFRARALLALVLVTAMGAWSAPGFAMGTAPEKSRQAKADTHVDIGDAPEVAGDRGLARELVAHVFDAYQGYTRESFDGVVSPAFVPMRSEFMNAVENRFYAGNLLDLQFFVDTVTSGGDKMAVRFDWEKRTAPRSSGGPVLSRGSAEYVFRNRGDVWRLYEVRGDDPLTRN
ncbi:MAG: hypothetical protein HQL11_02460 [Candidatus Omnitrophica bacterium]|nr:hypothetical protein [Candidatus Omnitrophota bacterium]